IVDGGNFDWASFPERQPALNSPDPSYHGAIWTEATKPLGPIAYIIKARVTLLRDLVAALSPFNAFQFIQGIEKVSLSLVCHSRNAQKESDWLSTRVEDGRVIHSYQLERDERERADNYLGESFVGLMGF